MVELQSQVRKWMDEHESRRTEGEVETLRKRLEEGEGRPRTVVY